MKRILAKIRKLFYKKADQCKQEKAAYVDGIPDGIAFETLNELCLHHLGESLKHVSHLHLSSWKAAGACRLLLRTQGHHHWSLIYKNAFYGLDHIPALADLPVVPGPPEFVVYNNIKGHLAQYLPAVYLCSEVVPKRHYQYLLEDLGEDYQRANKPEAILSVAAELPSFHGAMNKWSLAVGKDGLLRYGDRFSADLQQYVRRILESYVRSRKD
ncbi:MAG: hypothetical protein IMF11_08655, partial [Proteobacteria bacterium]|nr:hypothetical protein [Pseudomonadota bacterium]